MKKVRLLRVHNKKIKFQAEEIPDQNLDNSERNAPISKEVIKKKPIVVGSEGFTAWQRITRRTDNGMEFEVEKPILVDGMGNVIQRNELKGQCAVCEKYVSQIFYCYVDGCKIPLCRRHAYAFGQGDERRYYCPAHYKQVVEEFDTWQEYQDKRTLKEKNEK